MRHCGSYFVPVPNKGELTMPTAPMYLKPDSTYYPREKPIHTPWSFKAQVSPLEEDDWSESEIEALKRAGKIKVDEAEYWEKYAEDVDENYEWNDGYLEVKPVSDILTNTIHDWFTKLIDYYLTTHRNGQKIFLEMPFRLPLPYKTVARKPDYGVVLHSNPVPLEVNKKIHSYQGICDLCVEALSDTKQEHIERDTKMKYQEYAAGGVKEYYILYANDDALMSFYRLNAQGVYAPIKPGADGLIQSSVLPGFQFRPEDLHRRPEQKEMACDPVYEKFVFPDYKKVLLEKEQERQEKELALQKVAKMAEQLQKLGIDPDKL